MPIKNSFTLDMDIEQPMVDEAPLVTQRDNVEFVINVLKDGQPFDVTGVDTVSMVTTRKDGKVIVDDGVVDINSTNVVIVDVSGYATLVPGTAKFTIQLYDVDQNRVSTLFGMFVVQEDMSNNKNALPEDDQSLIAQVLGEGPQILSATQIATADAKDQGDYAKAQGDFAKAEGNNIKTNWLAPQTSLTAVQTAYPNPQFGDTVMTTDDGKIYRYENGWKHTQTYTDTAITNLQNNKLDITTHETFKANVTMFPQNVVVVFDDITVGDFTLTRNLVELGTVTLG